MNDESNIHDILTLAYGAIASGQKFKPNDPQVLRLLSRFGFVVGDESVDVDPDTELLDPDAISAVLSEDLEGDLREFEILPCVGSTNDLMQQRAQEMSIGGTVLMTEVQTAGRGRRGRRWETPFGKNIAMSLGMSLDMPAASLAPLSLVVGIAVVDALAAVGLAAASLKWPNDILVDGGKVGGILTELAVAKRPVEVVIGIGINVGGAQSIRNRLAAELINHVMHGCRLFEESGFGAFRERWIQLDAFRGRQVLVTGPREKLEGVAAGVDCDGRLIIQESSGEQRSVIAGDVSLREMA